MVMEVGSHLTSFQHLPQPSRRSRGPHGQGSLHGASLHKAPLLPAPCSPVQAPVHRPQHGVEAAPPAPSQFPRHWGGTGAERRRRRRMRDGRSMHTWGGSRALVRADPLSPGPAARERRPNMISCHNHGFAQGREFSPPHRAPHPTAHMKGCRCPHPTPRPIPLPTQPLGWTPWLASPAASPG